MNYRDNGTVSIGYEGLTLEHEPAFLGFLYLLYHGRCGETGT